ncbi:MAG: PASTA domain-containing protein, partial [Terrimesophilobacter sp.]
SSKNSSIPAELDELVLWATARDPEQRPRDAKAMLEQVQETRRLMSEVNGRTPNLPLQTVVMPNAPLASAAAETQVLASRVRQRTGPVAFDNTTTLAKRADQRRARGRWFFALVAILAILAGTTGWYFGSGPGSKVVIPEVSGTNIAEGTSTLQKADLVVAETVREEFSITIPDGKIVGTNPGAGQSVAHGGTVTLIVSKGPQPLTMPVLVGLTEEAARTALNGQFDLQESTYLFNQDVAAGIVLSAFGVGRDGSALDLATVTEYWEGQPVTLTVSLGPIPNVKGMSVDDAKQALADKELVGSTTEDLHDWSDDVPKGSVIGVQVPEGTAVTKGTVLQIIVSDGVEQVTVPSVTGKTWTEARALLKAAGFIIVFRDPLSQALSGFPDNAVVRDINPTDGTSVDKGSTVNVKLKTKD